MTNPVDQAAVHLARAAHIDTPQRIAQREFDQAWRLAERSLRGTAWRLLHDRDLVDEAISRAALKLWTSIRNHYQPRDGWAHIANTAVRFAAADILSAHTRHDPERNELPDDTHDDADDYNDLIDDLDTIAAAAQARTHLRHLADIAEHAYHQPLWARILHAEADGHHGGAAIGTHINVKHVTIRAALHAMRHAHIRDGALPPTYHGWQLQLFPIPLKSARRRRTTKAQRRRRKRPTCRHATQNPSQLRITIPTRRAASPGSRAGEDCGRVSA